MSVASFSAAARAAISVSSIALGVAVTWCVGLLGRGLLLFRVSRPGVESTLPDVLDNAVRYQVPDRLPGRDPVTALAARDRQRGNLHQRDLPVRQPGPGQPVPRPRAADEVREREQRVDVVPSKDVRQGICASYEV